MYFNGQQKFTLNEDTGYENEEIYPDFSLSETGQMVDEEDTGYGVVDEAAVLEAMIVDHYERLGDEARKALMNDPEFQNLMEAGVVGRRSFVRLNKADDLARRMTVLSLQMAKEANSPDFMMYKKFRKKEKEALAKIRKKFAPRVRRQAIVSQKRLVKLNPKAFNLNTPMR